MNVLLAHNFYKFFAGEDSIALREKGLLENNGESVYFYSKDNTETDNYGLFEKINFFKQTVFSQTTKQEIKGLIDDFKPHVAYTHNIFPLISPSIIHTLHSQSIPCVQNVQDFRWLCPNGVFYINDKICEKCKKGAFWNSIRHKCFRDSFLLSGLYATTICTNRLAGVFKKIDAFLCTTEFNKQKLMEAGIEEKRLFIKPNFLDITDIKPSFGNGNHIIFLGRLSPEKGLWTLVKAFEKMKDVLLHIVGTGPLEQALKKYIQEQQINNIVIDGFKQGKEKTEILKNSLFMVFPSEWYEHFPIVLLEAFAFGKPVVASNIGNMPLIVENGKSGLHFKAGDINDLVEKIRTLAQNPSDIVRMGQYARNKVEMEYTPEINYKILKSIFQKLAH